MPSIDESLLLELYDSGKWLIVAEQNNGYIWSKFQKVLFRQRNPLNSSRLVSVNTLGSDGQPRFIHSATYSQLVDQFGLSSFHLEVLLTQLNFYCG